MEKEILAGLKVKKKKLLTKLNQVNSELNQVLEDIDEVTEDIIGKKPDPKLTVIKTN